MSVWFFFYSVVDCKHAPLNVLNLPSSAIDFPSPSNLVTFNLSNAQSTIVIVVDAYKLLISKLLIYLIHILMIIYICVCVCVCHVHIAYRVLPVNTKNPFVCMFVLMCHYTLHTCGLSRRNIPGFRYSSRLEITQTILYLLPSLLQERKRLVFKDQWWNSSESAITLDPLDLCLIQSMKPAESRLLFDRPVNVLNLSTNEFALARTNPES